MIILFCVRPKFSIPSSSDNSSSYNSVILLKVLYSYNNADQFSINWMTYILMSIAGNEPDLILISEVVPKVHSLLQSGCS